jgi:membrane protease subunit (stomatin/prohibitin family)
MVINRLLERRERRGGLARMGNEIEVFGDYEDLSTDLGFQFEFKCGRCGGGIRTPFKASAVGAASEALEAASGILGCIFGAAADVGERVRSSSWETAHDNAFKEAVEHVKPKFVKCPRCSEWVCRESCWNTKRGLCKQCAPDLGVEMSAAQASRSVEEAWAHAAMAEEDKKLGKEYWRETIRGSCPNCEAPLASNAKFCPECGAKLKDARFCEKCGAKMSSEAKFCPECGEKVT